MAGEMGGIDKAIQIVRKLQNCTNHDEVNDSVHSLERSSGQLNLDALAKLKRDVETLTKEVQRLSEEGQSLEMILANRGFVFQIPKQLAETTALEMVREIMEDLVANDEVRRIGVYGMGGVGKTTVMNIVNNQLVKEHNDKFDRVIWVSVPTSSEIMKLQDDVARQLSLQLLRDDDVIMRAANLSSALQSEGRYVLILDNVWKGFDLDDVGTPEPSLENGCKMVLTTRSLDVCNFMKCDQKIQMPHLSEFEACELFAKHVGADVANIQILKGEIEAVVKECACLPLAIKVVASAMAGKKEGFEWRLALHSLKGMFKEPNNEYGVVIERLRFSYERLKNDKLKEMVLFCSLYPKNHMIDKEELVEFLIDDGIIEGVKARQSQLDEGHSMIRTLQNVCLLQSATDKCVKMHDLIRDMAVQITNINPHRLFMVEAGLQLKEIPEKEKWVKGLVKVSLMSNDISEIRRGVSPNCPNLSTLTLQNNRPLTNVPGSFFKLFIGLKVLNLSNTDIQSLPNSVSSLTNLVALSLNGCRKLCYVPSLKRIKGLRKLDLHRTLIDEVPKGLKKLTSLRFLDLSETRLSKIPKGTISKLHKLEFLSTCFVPIEDLLSLQKLETFEGALIGIRSLNKFSKHMDDLEKRLTSYFLFVSDRVDPLSFVREKHIRWRKNVVLFDCSLNQYDSLKVPTDVQFLVIHGDEHMMSLSECISNHVTGLKNCLIMNCDRMEHILSSSSSFSSSLSIQILEHLTLMELNNFRGFIRSNELGVDQLQCDIFSRLKRLFIFDCPTIKEVFPLWFLSSSLKNLEYIWVNECEELVEIAGDLSEEEKKIQGPISSITLPKLLVLSLWNLPKLKSICPTSTVLICHSLIIIDIEECHGLKRMPFELALNSQGQPSSLETIRVKEEEQWNQMEWNHPNYKTVLQPFCEFGELDFSEETESDEEPLPADTRFKKVKRGTKKLFRQIQGFVNR